MDLKEKLARWKKLNDGAKEESVRKVLTIVQRHPDGITAGDIAEKASITWGSADKILCNLSMVGVVREELLYFPE